MLTSILLPLQLRGVSAAMEGREKASSGKEAWRRWPCWLLSSTNCGRGTSKWCCHSMDLEPGSWKLLLTIALFSGSVDHQRFRFTRQSHYHVFPKFRHIQISVIYSFAMVSPDRNAKTKTTRHTRVLQSPLAFGSVGTCPIYLPVSDLQQTATVWRPFSSAFAASEQSQRSQQTVFYGLQVRSFSTFVTNRLWEVVKKNILTGKMFVFFDDFPNWLTAV